MRPYNLSPGGEQSDDGPGQDDTSTQRASLGSGTESSDEGNGQLPTEPPSRTDVIEPWTGPLTDKNFGALFERFLDHMDTFADRYTKGDADVAYEILQRAALKAISFLRSSDRKIFDDHAVPWFFMVLNNTSIDYYRERKRRQAIDSLDKVLGDTEVTLGDTLPDNTGNTPLELTVTSEMFTRIIRDLSPAQLKLLELLLDGLSLPEIAAATGNTYGSTGVSIHRLRTRIRRLIAAYDAEE